MRCSHLLTPAVVTQLDSMWSDNGDAARTIPDSVEARAVSPLKIFKIGTPREMQKKLTTGV
jgi:hypothetical protein